MPATHHRVVIRRNGDPDVLELIEEPLPEPARGQVRVHVLAAGVGYSDVMAQRGGYPLAPRKPFTPGYDFAGIVDRLGDGVTGLREGQYVAALNPLHGSYAEYVCVDPRILVPVPDGLDAAEVVSLVLNYLTAHAMLHRKARLAGGESVLIHAAAGGVGSALLQLGGLLGLRMYGTASAARHDIVRAGGGMPIDYRHEDFVERIHRELPGGVDAAFDPFGGANLRRSYRAVRRGGVVVSYGFAGEHFGGLAPMAAGVLQLAALKLWPDGKRVHLCATPGETKSDNAWYRRTLAELLSLLADGHLRPIVGARVPLREAARAHRLMEAGGVSGKVVLVCV
ncbi:MAG: medium chain dehydrogenase/reductase family protein [Solimonas sp.]